MSVPGQGLFDLLPALYRLRDAQLAQSQGLATGPLQSLLMLIDEQFDLVADDLAQRYDDHFIETCASWVIPYIGDLIGYQLVNGVARAVASPRAEVADTVSFRRRKGTVLVLEQLARDVTGWGASAVEFFQRLAGTQYLKHCRPENFYAPDLRRWQPALYMDGAFDTTAHQVDVRRISSMRGRYNIQNIGIFLWSLNAYGNLRVAATAVDAGGQLFRISSLGADLPLFNNPISQGPDILTAAQPVNVPDRLSRFLLNADVQSGVGAVYYGEGRSVALYLNDALLNPYQIQICNLSGSGSDWANLPQSGNPFAACFDPELGRIALVTPLDPPPPAGSATPLLEASFYLGFGADMGGGDYSRADSFIVQDEAAVFAFPDTAATPRYSTLQEAIDFAAARLEGGGEVAVEITNCGVYSLPESPALKIDVPDTATLELRAAQGYRPTLSLGGEIAVAGTAQSTVSLNGLLIVYASPATSTTTPAALLHAPAADGPGNLKIAHCTLVPGWALTPARAADPRYAGLADVLVESPGLALSIEKSIVGALWVSAEANAAVADSLIDATGPMQVAYADTDGKGGGGALALQGCTVVGKVHASQLLMSDSMVLAELTPADAWSAALWSDREQQGCVRFSYVPASAILPPQYECATQAAQAPQPLFYSLQYGDPGYGKLMPATDDSIRRGAHDEGEMGAFHFVLAPQRESDLRVRLQEYLPAGLEFGIFYKS